MHPDAELKPKRVERSSDMAKAIGEWKRAFAIQIAYARDAKADDHEGGEWEAKESEGFIFKKWDLRDLWIRSRVVQVFGLEPFLFSQFDQPC